MGYFLCICFNEELQETRQVWQTTYRELKYFCLFSLYHKISRPQKELIERWGKD